MEHDQTSNLVLPVGITGRADVGRLYNEVQLIDNYVRQEMIRAPETNVALPRISRLCNEIIVVNKLNLLQETDRVRLIAFLESLKDKAPTLHMSFSVDPSTLFITKLVTWLRREIHPLVLLQVGLQPNIGAGAIVRTTNKYFDFSLRQRFKDRRSQLIDLLRSADRVREADPKPKEQPTVQYMANSQEPVIE